MSAQQAGPSCFPPPSPARPPHTAASADSHTHVSALPASHPSPRPNTCHAPRSPPDRPHPPSAPVPAVSATYPRGDCYCLGSDSPSPLFPARGTPPSQQYIRQRPRHNHVLLRLHPPTVLHPPRSRVRAAGRRFAACWHRSSSFHHLTTAARTPSSPALAPWARKNSRTSVPVFSTSMLIVTVSPALITPRLWHKPRPQVMHHLAPSIRRLVRPHLPLLLVLDPRIHGP